MIKDEMIDLVQRQLDAYNLRDLEGFCSCYHPEVKVERLITTASGLNGVGEFKEVYRKLFNSNPNLKCEIRNRAVLETSVVDEEFVTGASQFPQGLHTVAIYGFRDGLIDRVWFAR